MKLSSTGGRIADSMTVTFLSALPVLLPYLSALYHPISTYHLKFNKPAVSNAFGKSEAVFTILSAVFHSILNWMLYFEYFKRESIHDTLQPLLPQVCMAQFFTALHNYISSYFLPVRNKSVESNACISLHYLRRCTFLNHSSFLLIPSSIFGLIMGTKINCFPAILFWLCAFPDWTLIFLQESSHPLLISSHQSMSHLQSSLPHHIPPRSFANLFSLHFMSYDFLSHSELLYNSEKGSISMKVFISGSQLVLRVLNVLDPLGSNFRGFARPARSLNQCSKIT